MRKLPSKPTRFALHRYLFLGGVYVSFLCMGTIAVEQTIASISTSENVGTAQSESEELEEPQSRPPKIITSYSLQIMGSFAVVEEYIQDEDYAAAEQMLEVIWNDETELSRSEKAEVKYMSSRIAHIRQDIDATIELLEDVLEYRENISYEREEEILLRLTELHLSKKQNSKAHDRLNEWLDIVEEPRATELAFAGNLFVKIKSYRRAKEFLSRAIEQQREQGAEVDSRWSDLLEYVEKQLRVSQ